MLPRAGQRRVVEILPDSRMLLQINDHGRLATGFINDKLNPAHAANVTGSCGKSSKFRAAAMFTIDGCYV